MDASAKYIVKKFFLTAAISLPLFAQSQGEDITVIGHSFSTKNPEIIEQRTDISVKADSAMTLDEIPGLTLSRKGAHGNEIIMRGQKNGINILVEDKYIHGGCPNHMDPATSYIVPEFYDIIEVESGVTSLSEGRGGPAGSLRFVDKEPIFSQENPQLIHAQVGTGFEDNSNTQHHYTRLSFGNDKIMAKAQYSYKKAQDYEDGKGASILSSYEQQNSNIKLYWRPSSQTNLSFRYDNDLAKDVMNQGLMMNSPRSEAQSYQIQISQKLKNSLFRELKASIYSTDVDHLMDNATTTTMPYYGVQIDSITRGGKVQAHFEGDGLVGNFGFDIQNLKQDIHREFAGPLFSTYEQGAHVNQWGLFSEAEKSLNEKQLLKVGLRYDHVKGYGDKLEKAPSAMVNSALTEYQIVYGHHFSDHEAKETENNISALIRYKRKETEHFNHSLSLSRTLRTANPYERYLHQPSMVAAMKRTGNPDLKPEAHHQIDYSALWKREDLHLRLSAYYNRVDDFISIDRAHGQPGININDSRLIYRNVDAFFWGANVEGKMKIASNLNIGASLSSTYGKNKTDHRPLYEIPPLLLDISSQYSSDRFGIQLNIRSQLKQTRVDDKSNLGSGVDAGKTPGWAIANLSFNITPLSNLKQWKIFAGVNNLFDKTYARHLNYADALTATQVRVNDPGRSFWLRTQYKF